MTPKERAKKFHADDVSLNTSGKCFWLVVPRGKFASTNQKHYPDQGSDTSSDGIFALVPRTSFRWETSGGISANSLGENKNKNSRKYVRGNYRSKWNLKLVDEGDAEKSGEYTKANGEEAIAREGRP